MNILFINPTEEACGVYQFGKNTYNAIKGSKKYDFVYLEPYNDAECVQFINQYNPVAILYNYYPCTMPWVTLDTLARNRKYGIKQLSILHELEVTSFDYLINPDPTFEEYPGRFRVGRPLIEFYGTYSQNSIVTIGSFGFGMGWKGFPELVTIVNDEFDEAVVNLLIPYAFWGDRDGVGANRTAELCRERVTKPGIKLNIEHNFLSSEELLQFLANNDLNAFIYPIGAKGGISSCMDAALSVKRPVAITKAEMFRHIYNAEPSVCVEDTTLRKILENGVKPLEGFYERFSNKVLTEDYERIFEVVL